MGTVLQKIVNAEGRAASKINYKKFNQIHLKTQLSNGYAASYFYGFGKII